MTEGDRYEGKELPRGWTIKTDGNSNEIIVRDPLYYNEDGYKRKVRHKPTNITPKKKKRKK
jgi:hypothetical protein